MRTGRLESKMGFPVVSRKDDHLEVQPHASESRGSYLPTCLPRPLSTGLKHVLLLEATAEVETKTTQLPNP